MVSDNVVIVFVYSLLINLLSYIYLHTKLSLVLYSFHIFSHLSSLSSAQWFLCRVDWKPGGWWVSWQQQSDSNAFNLHRTQNFKVKTLCFCSLARTDISFGKCKFIFVLKCLLKSGFQGVGEYNYCIKKMLCSKQRLSIYELELIILGMCFGVSL